jgi:hypothetical protein
VYRTLIDLLERQETDGGVVAVDHAARGS